MKIIVEKNVMYLLLNSIAYFPFNSIISQTVYIQFFKQDLYEKMIKHVYFYSKTLIIDFHSNILAFYPKNLNWE